MRSENAPGYPAYQAPGASGRTYHHIRQPGVRRVGKEGRQKSQSREKKLERYQESDERIEKPKLSWQMKLEFSHPTH